MVYWVQQGAVGLRKDFEIMALDWLDIYSNLANFGPVLLTFTTGLNILISLTKNNLRKILILDINNSRQAFFEL